MTNFNCINCSSKNIKILQNSNFITSQDGYKELTKLKQQKEKQLKEDKGIKVIQEIIRTLPKILKQIIFLLIGKRHGQFISIFKLIIAIQLFRGFLYDYFNVFFWILIHILLMNILELSDPLFKLKKIMEKTIRIFSIIVSFFESFKKDKKRNKQIEKINQTLENLSNLYYCDNCNKVMDLDNKIYDKTENINHLIYQLYQK